MAKQHGGSVKTGAFLRKWIAEKLPSFDLSGECSKERLPPGVMTPESLPEFIIPGRAAQGGANVTIDEKGDTSRRQTPQDGRIRKLIRSMTMDGSQEVSPDTNADPGSLAAVSLPHLRTQTSFGFTTVSQLPNTRRKESLLLGSHNLESLRHFQNALNKRGEVGKGTACNKTTEGRLYASTLVTGESRLSLLSKSSGEASPQFSPTVSPGAKRSGCRPSYRRRTSSQPDPNESSESQESGCGDNVDNKAEETHQNQQQLQQMCAVLGEIKLSLCYDKASRGLRVLVIKAENLTRQAATDEHHVNTFLKLCLMPGKRQKRQSHLVRNTKSPIYNEEFFFVNVSIDDISGDLLRMRVMNKSGSLRKDDVIGEVCLPLETLGLHLGEEVRMWRDLEQQSENQGLGVLHSILKFEPREEKLFITVVDVRNLHKSTLSGLPDAYVKIVVSQPKRPSVHRQTRVRPGTINPVFKETFEFRISPKVDDLAYTSVLLVVCRREKLRTDVVLGAVMLGYSNMENTQARTMAHDGDPSECYQWHTALQHPCIDVAASHLLMDPRFDSNGAL